jgi:hypothetical protein
LTNLDDAEWQVSTSRPTVVTRRSMGRRNGRTATMVRSAVANPAVVPLVDDGTPTCTTSERSI